MVSWAPEHLASVHVARYRTSPSLVLNWGNITTQGVLGCHTEGVLLASSGQRSGMLPTIAGPQAAPTCRVIFFPKWKKEVWFGSKYFGLPFLGLSCLLCSPGGLLSGSGGGSLSGCY